MLGEKEPKKVDMDALSPKDELKYEIADVMNYCILLCHQIGVDPKQIILDKMKISEKKYPIDKSKGVSTKYDKL